jgi:hypothetical protein
MSFLNKLFHKKNGESSNGRNTDPADAPPPYSDTKDAASLGIQDSKPDDSKSQGITATTASSTLPSAPPGILAPKDLGPAPPPHLASAYGNAGMQAGMFASVAGAGGSMGSDMLVGQVAGNMIGQRIDQAQNHAYWRQRQQEYLAGYPDAAANPGAPQTERQKRREQRRKDRWERRADRRQ